MITVLMIGNSYTYFNELWTQFGEISKSAGIDVTVDHVTKGGWYLHSMNDPEDTYGAQVAEFLQKKRYDVVFLQEQSVNPIGNYEDFENSIQSLAQKFQAKGSRVIFYQTWGRKTGHEILQKYGWTHESMTADLRSAYRRAAQKCGAEVSPVGDAFSDVYKNHPEIELYNADLTHPSLAGTYLAALCHFATVFHRSPLGISYRTGAESDTDVAILQAAADAATSKK